MSDEAEPKRTPAKAQDLDFKALADELTKTPEKVDTRPPDVQVPLAEVVADASTEEKDEEDPTLADNEPADGEEAPPGAAKGGKPGPAARLGLAVATLGNPIFGPAGPVPDPSGGAMRAASERLLNQIVYRLLQRIDEVLERVDELPILEQAKMLGVMKELWIEAADLQITAHWTKKLEKAILERATLLQHTKGPHLRKVAGYAAQIGKEQKGDGRTVAQRNKKSATVGRLPASDMPGAEQG